MTTPGADVPISELNHWNPTASYIGPIAVYVRREDNGVSLGVAKDI
jgi:hypothetical protein